MRRIDRPARLLAGLAIAACTLLGGFAQAHAAAATLTTADPSNTYRLSYPADWTVSNGDSGFSLGAPDGNAEVVTISFAGQPSSEPLARTAPSLPGVLKIGETSSANKILHIHLHGYPAEAEVVHYTRTDGGSGALIVIRAYDQGRVCYLIGVIKDTSQPTTKMDEKQTLEILFSAYFAS